MGNAQVLIVGAGPTGLVLALWLTRMGIPVRIIDKLASVSRTSRALAVQARTLELYRQVDLARHVIEHGHRVAAINFWAKGEPAAHVAFNAIGADLTPYPFVQTFPQDEHERVLTERLAQNGLSIERGTELLGFVEEGNRVRVRLRTAEGTESECEVRYVAGCDGARSAVRAVIGAGFPGGTYRQVFYVADVEAAGPAINGELHVDLDEADILAIFPLADAGRVRLVGTVRDERADRADTLEFADVSTRAIENLKVQVRKVNWFSTYHVHHRVSDHFRKGCAFLLGDAAHIHSPVGGQGMNTGIGDSVNLAWKLAWVLRGSAPESVLDSYEVERIGFARRLVATTDRVFSFATGDGRIAELVRTRLAPLLIPRLMALDAVRQFLFRTAAQITINYRSSPLSAGSAGHVHGGDRLPWVRGEGVDNFDSLSIMGWQVHVYGTARTELKDWCSAKGIPLSVFEWREECGVAGLAHDALYLLRPDTYIALADSKGSPEAIERYCERQNLRL